MIWSLLTSILNHPILSLLTLAVIIITIIIKYSSHQKRAFWSNTNIAVGETPSIYEIIWKKIPEPALQQELVRKYGRIFGVYRFGGPTLYCSDPELISSVLSKDFTLFVNRRSLNVGDDEIVNSFISSAKDDNWKRLRAIVSPTFSSGKLRKMQPLIDDCLRTLVSNFEQLIADNNGHELDMKKPFGAFTMNVITQVAFGTKVDALADADHPIIMNARRIISRELGLRDVPKFALLILAPRLARLVGVNIFDERAIQFFKQLVRKIIAERQSRVIGAKRYDFLQLLLDAADSDPDDNTDKTTNADETDPTVEEQNFKTHNKTLSDIELISQCVIFLVAGYETTATTLSYAAYQLACNPDVQQRLYDEAKRALESSTPVDIDSLAGLKYVDAVVAETLRLHPPAPHIERTAAEDYAWGDGPNKIVVKKGVVVHIPTYSMHNDPHFFAEPEKFRPERFLPDQRVHHPYAYLPFGGGPRNCVARRMALMEAKLALMHAVYNFKFSPTDKTKRPPESYSNGGIIIPREVLLRVEKRDK